MISNSKTDELLVAAVARGDREALGELVRRHQDSAVGLAWRMLGRRDDAEDIAQEAFLRVLSGASRFRAGATFRTWFYRILANLCLDDRRRAKHKPVAIPEDAALPVEDAPDASLTAGERASAVRRAVEALPERQRAVLVLHRFENLSYREMEEVLGWTVAAIESLLSRAYATLRESLASLDRVE